MITKRRTKGGMRAALPVMLILSGALAGAATPLSAQDASSELGGLLAEELGVSAETAQQAAGSIFRIAREELSPEEWRQVVDAVPGIDGLVEAVSSADARTPLAAGGDAPGVGGPAASAASAFSQLGLEPTQVSTVVSTIGQYVSGRAGSDVAGLMTGLFQ